MEAEVQRASQGGAQPESGQGGPCPPPLLTSILGPAQDGGDFVAFGGVALRPDNSSAHTKRALITLHSTEVGGGCPRTVRNLGVGVVCLGVEEVLSLDLLTLLAYLRCNPQSSCPQREATHTCQCQGGTYCVRPYRVRPSCVLGPPGTDLGPALKSL